MAELSNENPELAEDRDALRLMLAFYCILEPEKRAEVMALARRYASDAEILDEPKASRRGRGQ